MTYRPFRRWLFVLLLLPLAWLGLPGSAHADVVECQASIPGGIDFGNFDPWAGSADTQATIDYSCANSDYFSGYDVTMCLNIGYGPLGQSGSGYRQMAGPGGTLEFQLYRDAGRTQVAGSVDTLASSVPIQVSLYVPARPYLGSPAVKSGQRPIYGRIHGGQTGIGAGTYSTSFAPGQLKITGYANNSGDCTGVGTDVNNFSSFPVSATVAPTCTVQAEPLDFGSVAGFLTSNVDAQSNISLQCVKGTNYKVGLDNGQHASGNVRRMLGPGGNLIEYALYSNPARSRAWGNNPGIDTVNRKAKGSVQNLTVYGRVPPQAQTTQPAGDYSDIVTVFVTY